MKAFLTSTFWPVLIKLRRPSLWSACIALGVMLTLASCGDKKPADQADGQTAAPKDLAIGQIVAIGRVEPEAKLTTLASEVSGLITKIGVSAGDSVQKGQLILTLSQEVEQAQLALTQSRVNTIEQDLTTQRAQLSSAEINRDNLTQRLPRLQALLAKGAETQQNVDNLEVEIAQANQEMIRIKATSNATMAKINELRADVNLSQKQLGKRTILAPANGEILNMDLTVGSILNAGAAICDFAPVSPLTTLVEVDELFTDRIYLGQKALLRTQGQQDTLAFGEVIYAAPALKKKSIFSDESSNLEDRRVREVRIRIISGKTLLYNSRVEVILFVKGDKKPTTTPTTTSTAPKQ